MNHYLDTNRSLWDGWTKLHTASAFYDVDGFKAGQSTLKPVERDELGDVAGKTLLHLQCHFGLDTLSWAREGAIVTGVDFSEEAIARARSLSAALDLPATFICSNLYDVPEVLRAAFDIVFTSYGVLTWLPDLARWAQIAARSLKPGGTFYLVEFHPLVSMLDDEGERIVYPYFHRDGPVYLERPVHHVPADVLDQGDAVNILGLCSQFYLGICPFRVAPGGLAAYSISVAWIAPVLNAGRRPLRSPRNSSMRLLRATL